MSKSLPILTPIPASVNPITFVPSTHIILIIIHSTTGTIPLMKFAFVNIGIAIKLNPAARIRPLYGLWSRPDGPKDGQMRSLSLYVREGDGGCLILSKFESLCCEGGGVCLILIGRQAIEMKWRSIGGSGDKGP
ncbi:hypothetical protein ACFE04_001680 [Oxalis oulophora]